MNGYIAFTKKEFMENTRNFRLLIMLVLFFIFGVMSPLTAKFMPQLIASLTPNLQITLTEPTALDSWEQFYKNVSTLGFSIMIILFSSCMSGEYSKGTLVNVVTKGLPRPAVVLSKFFTAAAIMTLSYWMCFGITFGYTAYFWQGITLPHTFFAAFAQWLAGLWYLSIIILGCVLFRQAFTAIVFLLAVTVAISLIGMPEQLSSYSPMFLASKNMDLLSGTIEVPDFFLPIVITLVMSIGFVWAAVSLFNRKLI